MKIFIGADHQGIKCKETLIKYLKKNDIDVEDSSIPNNPLDDYPDFANDVCQKVLKNDGLGILICKTGIGMSIAANKIKGIYCAKVANENEAFLCKNHNGANVISLDAFIDSAVIEKIVDVFITTKNPTDERHLRRIAKIKMLENK